MKGEYEKTIDTLDDLLESERIMDLAEDTPMKFMLDTDPRDKVKRIAKTTIFSINGISPPEHLVKR